MKIALFIATVVIFGSLWLLDRRPTVVAYRITASTVDCLAANKVERSQIESEGSTRTFVDCRWDCASYKGQEKKYVSLSFALKGDKWGLSRAFVSDGACPLF